MEKVIITYENPIVLEFLKDMSKYFDFSISDEVNEEVPYFVNVRESNWADSKKHGFIAAGQGKKYSNPIKKLSPGNIVAAYIDDKGYVGIGRVVANAVKVNDFKIDGTPLTSNKNKIREQGIFHNSDNEDSDFLIKTEWIKAVDSKDAKWEKRKRTDMLFTSRQIRASLANQPETIKYLEKEFKVNFNKLLLKNA